MRKTFAWVMAIWITACMLGCSTPEEPAPAENPEFKISYMETDISINAPAQPVIEALGTPRTYTEENSCFFEGLDKTYYYGGFYITTYPAADGDRIHSLWFADDSQTTPEGITIGSDREAVEQAYGEGCFGSGDVCVLTRGDSTMTVVLEDNRVATVRYDAVIE